MTPNEETKRHCECRWSIRVYKALAGAQPIAVKLVKVCIECWIGIIISVEWRFSFILACFALLLVFFTH